MLPCHCIIAHPEKPKFLVIRHTERWSPPMLQLPEEGSLMYKPALINQGMMRKYGLRTTVLRIFMEARNYAVLELEMHASSRRRMEAVWVGWKEYQRYRTRPGGENDPFEQWLKEREGNLVPELRAPWEREGWYREAEQWVTNRLVEQGIQATGSVQQFKAGWPTACILRVATVQGQIFFKATYDKPPGEARLTQTLAEKWPDRVPRPLAVDENRNWMLMRDFKIKNDNRPAPENFPDFARTMGQFQVEAMQHMEEWRALDCPVMNLAFLHNADGRAEELFVQVEKELVSGINALEDSELTRLAATIAGARQTCTELAAFGIPDSLAHLDFRPDNFFLEDGQCMIIGWADVVITHPFMALCRTFDFFELHGTIDPSRQDAGAADETLMVAMRDAYLEAFSAHFPECEVRAAFEKARAVFTLFWFYYAASQTRIIEARTPAGGFFRNVMKVKARKLIQQMGE